MRISREQKSAYVRAATEKKLKLSEWVTEKLDEAVSK
jgi:predicted HicB family RNase H-like nuclease